MSVKIREKQLKNGTVSLYLDIIYKGSRNYEFLDLQFNPKDTPKQNIKEIRLLAEKQRAEREHSLFTDQYDPKAKGRKILFIDFLNEVIKSKKKRTAQTYLFLSKQVLKHPQIVNLPLEKLSTNVKLWDSFFNSLSADYKNSTISLLQTTLMCIFNQAIKNDIIQSHKLKLLKKHKVEPPLKQYLTVDELRLIENEEFTPIIKRPFLFSCYTGLRYSDIIKLTFSDIKEDKLEIRQTKTKQPIYIPLSQKALEIIKQVTALNPQAKVFRHFYPAGAIYSLKEVCKRLNINKNITFHSARHTFAVLNLAAGIDIFTVSKMLGHTDVQTTLVYAKIVSKTFEDARDKFERYLSGGSL